jgi:hypothetical protein
MDAKAPALVATCRQSDTVSSMCFERFAHFGALRHATRAPCSNSAGVSSYAPVAATAAAMSAQRASRAASDSLASAWKSTQNSRASRSSVSTGASPAAGDTTGTHAAGQIAGCAPCT